MSQRAQVPPVTRVVLVGAGHTHIQVLRHWISAPNPHIEATLVVDTPVAVYSGMVPGLVAGKYRAQELEIDAAPLARRAGARIVLAPCIGVEAEARNILIEGRSPLPFDVASFDVGATVVGLELPGVRDHAVPTRPINRLAPALEARLDAMTTKRPRVVVVGSGAGGIELAFCIDARLRRHGLEPTTTIVEASDRLLPGYHPTLTRRIEARAKERGIRTEFGAMVVAVEEDRVRLEGGETLPSDLTFWVTGADSLPLFRNSKLPVCDRGFALTRATLQIDGHDRIFAVGDCATLIDHPNRRRAGVYAVRMGPYLIDNLERLLAGRPLRRYRPQGDFLALLNLGDGTAVGAKWGRAFEGGWIMRLKDWIDRRFVHRFQALNADGAPSDWLEQMALDRTMNGEDGSRMGGAGPDGEPEAMFCGGCAAKIGPEDLGRALARANLGAATTEGERAVNILLDTTTPDDAVAYGTPAGERIVASLDAFPAFTDDPWLVGRVAAANACSDLYATGVEPAVAQALVTLPQDMDGRRAEDVLIQVLGGARAALDPDGVQLLGGHTNTGPQLTVGFHVEGLAANGEELLLKSAVRPGDELFLTKPLGTGVLLAADRMGRCPGRCLRSCFASMQTSNRKAMKAARRANIFAATDVSGFGLAGHVGELAEASRVDIEIDVGALPALPGALDLLSQGVRSTSHDQNTRLPVKLERRAEHGARLEIAFDPQTAGGLILAAAGDRAADLVRDLHALGLDSARRIGRAVASREARPRLILR